MSESKRPTKSDDNPALDSTMVLNPVVGVSAEEMLRTASDLIGRALLQPGVALGEGAALWTDLMRIAFDRSELEPAPRDRRFGHSAWQSSRGYRQALQGWLAWHRSLGNWVDKSDFDDINSRRAHFFVDLIADAFAPTNFLLGNPSALERARETSGRSLLRGLQHYIDDLLHNAGMPSQVDKSKFAVGENVACTEGSVVFRSDLVELIQYRPTAGRVRKKPCFIVPPQINKYYVYDISPEKSFVKHAVDQGFQVFIISWRNPGPEHSHWGLDDYVAAIDEAIDATLEITGEDSVNGVGACAGGITFAATLGYLTAIEKSTVSSLTLMVNVLVNDPEDSVMGLFTTDRAVDAARKRSARKGILDGGDTARIFSWMRPNDLIWNYVSSNYLHGENPPAFDILYWNSDVTNLPARLHSDFLEVFEGNPLKEQGELVVRDQPIDLQQVTCDTYITGGSTDHITPWQACYRSTQLFGGEVTYVLSTAGHIQSIVNPPAGSKRKYYLNPELPPTTDEWLENTSEHEGSWWTHWYGWLKTRSGKTAPRRAKLGSRKHPVLCPAPGTYVLE